jgi:spore coat protein H
VSWLIRMQVGALFLALLLGCSSVSDGGDATGDVSVGLVDAFLDVPSGETTENPTESISFDLGHMVVVEIEMDPTDWATLNTQTAFGADVDALKVASEMADNCAEPWPKEYTWFPATVTIDGVTLEQVGVRRKGFIGSLFAKNPALKLKTDKFVEGQLFGETERITLNNNAGDETHLATCVVYQVFAMAGHPAPLCNLASVSVNGESLGLYIHIEAIKKRFLKRAFGDKSGSLYEGVAVDFVEEWLPRFEAKTSDTDETWAPLLGVAQALQASDEELVAALEPVLNVERFITFWALEVILNHVDGYSGNRNNFQVYFDPADGDRAVLIPWGIDKTPSGMDNFSLSGALYAELPRRLSRNPEIAAAMVAELDNMMVDVWDADVLIASVDSLEALVEANGGGNPSVVEGLREWIHARPDSISKLISGGLPPGAEEMAGCGEWGKDSEGTCEDACLKEGGTKEECEVECADGKGDECKDGETFEKNGTTYVCVDGQWTDGEKDDGGGKDGGK